jgi:Bacterial lectin/Abnormal spindle-like microcephaly-assoc'd, ASPM-SPD-2-Hydin
VTATPVIDPATNTAYLTHKTYVSGSSGTARWYMDAVDITTGKEKAGFPVELAGAAQNQPGQVFQPTRELQRPGLLLMNGVVYAAFGSSCDFSPWQGWVMGVSTTGQIKARWVAVPTGNGAGIWQSGAGLTSDGPNTLMVSTGNTGAPTTPTPGKSPPNTFGESIVRLNVQPDGSLKAVDFFAPFDADQLDTWDADFASGGITALNSEYFGTASVPHLAVAVGKDGYVYLLNRDELGGFMQGPSGSDKVVQRIGPYGGVWSRPGVWPGDGGWIYIPTASGGESAGGSSGFLRVYKYGVSGTGQPTISLQASSSDAFGFTSSMPDITSDGTTSGSALVWVIWTPNGSGAGAQLRAYDPVPVNGKPVLRWSAPIGTSAKFVAPGVGAGRLYVGTRDGKVLGFGSPVTPLLTGSATSFPTTTIANSSKKTLTLTATNALTLSKLSSSSSQFTVGTPTPALPAQLAAGQTIQIPLTFTPSQAGLVGGTLTAETDKGTVSFAMSGTGQNAAAQLAVTPTVLSFDGTTVGGHVSAGATFQNVGGAPLTINAVKLPGAPFGATGLPAPGSTIAAGSSLTINVTFDPTSEGNFSDELELETSAGTGTIALAGSAGSAGALQVTGEHLEYAPTAVGATTTKSFTITNTGATAVALTKSKPPAGAFTATTSLPEGTTIAPGASLTETVAFTPTAPGYASASWPINGNDSTGLHEVTFAGTGTVPAPGTAWSHNGTATIAAGAIRTTAATVNAAGSAFFATPLESRHLIVEFDQTIGSGTGADGQTLTFADASKAASSALGVRGGGLGFSGIPGIAVAFDTYKGTGAPSNNFVGLTDGPTSASVPDVLHWIATATPSASLRATHHVKVELLSGAITVFIDGTKVLSGTATFAPKVLLGFTGGTGGQTDVHEAANVVVSGDAPPTGPQPATLTISSAIKAPAGSPQTGTQLAYSGTCPSSFTTAALANGGSATPALTGAVAGSSCTVSQAAPSESGWSTTASVNGGSPVALTAVAGKLTVPAFALSPGTNTVQFTNTYTASPAPATLKISNTINAPSGSAQAATQLTYSGSCPSSFTTAALASGASATPALTGAVAGSSCSVSEAAPSGSGWSATASVNGGAAISLTASAGQLTVPSFALVAGANTIQFNNTYTAQTGTSVPDPTAGGWQLNGSSTLSATELTLTPATAHQAGSAFWPQAIDPRNATVEYDATIGGGTGADGLGLVFADATRGALPSSLGAEGGGLGFGGIPGIAVALDEYKGTGAPSNNFVGISDGPTSPSTPGTLHWIATSNLALPLQNATNHIKVTTVNGTTLTVFVNGTTLTVFVNGTQVLSQAVTLPSSAYLGFSGGTGGAYNRHAVAHVLVTQGSGGGTPTPATLKISNTINAPSGSAQAATQLAYSGTCPSSFTTAALANGGSATPTLTGAVAGSGCSVAEVAPSGSGWTTTALVNGGTAIALSASGGQLTVPSFALAAGANTVQFTNTYTAQTGTSVPDPTAGGWQLNGSSTLSATELALTAATSHQAGSAFWPHAIDPRNLTVEYDATIGGGTGADGLGFVLGDATRGALASSLGAEGGGLGFSGIPGIAVALDEYKGTGAPSNNFVGISDGPTSPTVPGVLHWIATSNLALPLQNATNHIKVATFNGTTLTVSVNGTQVLSQAVTLPSSAYLGFSGGTGGLNNRHAVAHVLVSGA